MLRTEHLSASKAVGREALSHVRDVSLKFAPEKLHLICGADGCGKNLLLRLLGMLEEPANGELFVDDVAVSSLAEADKNRLRNEAFGFVLRSPFLLPAFSAVENVAMPLFKIRTDISIEEARNATETALALVGLSDSLEARIADLSFGKQCCVALARALAHRPRFLLVEDIDAELVDHDLHIFAERLRNITAAMGLTTIMTARTSFLPGFADRTIEISGGALRRDSRQPTL